ncbi:MAG TPA: LIC_13355 family lipoprotein [Leptospiraceae bacterium]|nr:LIC_13355 family lipoprotein [Leptospiraceae bacterium]
MSVFPILQKISILILSLVFFIHCASSSSKSGKTKAAAMMLLLSGSVPKSSAAPIVQPDGLADSVTSAPNHTGEGFKNKSLAVNGVRGEGQFAGSTDVFSLAQTGAGASIVLEWQGKRILNGAGIDFNVFENPFQNSDTPSLLFMEPFFVEVSADNINYCGFNPLYTYSTPSQYSRNPAHWSRFAGITPVKYNVEKNPLTGNDIFDVSKAGGDAFDLDSLSADNTYSIGCSETLKNTLKTSGFVYLRLTAASARINPATGAYYPVDSGAYDNGPDIDGVIARYTASR